jgi:Lon protease-like protein
LQRLIDSRLADCVSAVDEANAALDLLAEPDLRNAAKVIADRLLTALTSPEFDVQMRLGPDMASTRLRRLMALRVRVHASAISQDHKAQVCAALARIERAIHSDAARAALRVAGLA